jgi:hypothetical protein
MGAWLASFWGKAKATEPARLAEFARTVLVGLVGLGWITVDDTTINTATSVVGLLVSWALTRFVRNRVAPVAKGE